MRRIVTAISAAALLMSLVFMAMPASGAKTQTTGPPAAAFVQSDSSKVIGITTAQLVDSCTSVFATAGPTSMKPIGSPANGALVLASTGAFKFSATRAGADGIATPLWTFASPYNGIATWGFANGDFSSTTSTLIDSAAAAKNQLTCNVRDMGAALPTTRAEANDRYLQPATGFITRKLLIE